MCKELLLTLLHSERPKLYGVLAVLSAVGLKWASSDHLMTGEEPNVMLSSPVTTED